MTDLISALFYRVENEKINQYKNNTIMKKILIRISYFVMFAISVILSYMMYIYLEPGFKAINSTRLTGFEPEIFFTPIILYVFFGGTVCLLVKSVSDCAGKFSAGILFFGALTVSVSLLLGALDLVSNFGYSKPYLRALQTATKVMMNGFIFATLLSIIFTITPEKPAAEEKSGTQSVN